MEVQETKKHFRILFSILAAASAVYMAVCIYAGWSGNLPFLQHKVLHISPLGVIRYVRWSLHSILSAMALVLCLYGVYRTYSRKKRYGTLALCLFLSYLVSILLSPGSENLRWMSLIMGLLLAGLFGFANLPGVIGRAITQKLSVSASEKDPDSSHLLGQMEWIRCFPLKKVLIAALWLFCPAVVVMGIVVLFREPGQDLGAYGTILLFLLVAVFTARKAWGYVSSPYHCVPILNRILTKEQLEGLLQGEHFVPVAFENQDLQKYIPIFLSENWALIEGLLISRKLAIRVCVEHQGNYGYGHAPRKKSKIQVTYLDGAQFQTRGTDLYLDGPWADEMNQVLRSIPGISIPRCSSEKILEQYRTILPEIQGPKEKLWHLLTQDVSATKQDYETTLAPKPQNPKKKKNQR